MTAPQNRKIVLIRHELGHFKDFRWHNVSMALSLMLSMWFLAILKTGGFDVVLSVVAAAAYGMLMANHFSRFFEIGADKFAARRRNGISVLELLVDLTSVRGNDKGSESHPRPSLRYKIVEKFARKGEDR
ncbi:MAG: M48 family metalloprotease [Nitrososphaerales archaeon]